MEIIVIALCIVCFAAYIFLYRFYGAEARVPIFALHAGVVALIITLAVLLWLTISNGYGQTAQVAAIAGIVGYGLLLLRYIFTELIPTNN